MEFAVSSSATRPIKPTSRPPARRERAKHYQLDAIAYMSVSGTSPGEMAATTGLSETYITRLLSEKRNKTFNKLRDEYKRKNLKNVVGPV
jgi:AraC-like DNA-binding protein